MRGRPNGYRKLKVLIVGQGPPTSGGIPTFVTRIVSDAGLRSNFDLEYLNTTPVGDKQPGGFTSGNVKQALSDARRVRRRGAEADIVHFHLAPVPTLPLMRALMLAGAGRMGGARVIVHAHSGRLAASLDAWSYRAILRALCRVIDALVVVSREAEVAAGRLCGKVIRVQNGIDVDQIDPVAYGGAQPVLSFVGTVCERKGLLDLRDALVRLRAQHDDGGLQVWIIGDARQEGPGVFERVRRAYAEAGLGDVEFLGRLDRTEVIERLRRSEIFCLPSHWEGSPLSVLEAMAARTAVVASAVGDIPEMLDGGRAGVLVEPGDAGELERVLRCLMTDPERRAELAQSARERVERHYTWQVTSRAIDDLYRRVADHSR